VKLLLCSDLHCDAEAARKLVEQAEDAGVDVLIGAGDFANMRRRIHVTLDILRAARCPAVLVPGNGESDEELREACRQWPQAHVLHGSGVSLAGRDFFGLGGAVPETPFGSWSFDLSEARAEGLLSGCPAGAVLVTHSPPHGVLDVDRGGSHLGSTSVRAAMERCRPELVVCGHVHACGGRHECFGETPVVNAGPKGIFWELPG
jgi:Icc-related predicted phosphoesterase